MDVLGRAEFLLGAGLTRTEVQRFLTVLAGTVLPIDLHFLWRPQLRDAGDEMVLETAAEEFAARDGVSLNRFIAPALAEKVGASESAEFFAERAAGAGPVKATRMSTSVSSRASPRATEPNSPRDATPRASSCVRRPRIRSMASSAFMTIAPERTSMAVVRRVTGRRAVSRAGQNPARPTRLESGTLWRRALTWSVPARATPCGLGS